MRHISLLLLITLLTTSAAAQQADRSPRRRGGGPGTLGSARLERSGLRVGMTLPDVTAYDADGNELRTSELRGHHTVLVFGCLT